MSKTDASAVLDLVLFFATLVCAFVFQWKATDLVWSLWLSSLVVGYLTLLFGWWVGKIPWREIFKQENRKLLIDGLRTTRPKDAFMVVGILLLVGIFLLCFFTVHFGMFHFIHGLFLSDIFPLEGIQYPKDGWHLPAHAFLLLQLYWPFVLASAISQFGRFEPVDSKKDQWKMAGLGPYKSVIRMHALIFVFVALKMAHAHNFLFYAVVLFAYFFPWKSVWPKKESSVSKM